jgi:hypothetical protein
MTEQAMIEAMLKRFKVPTETRTLMTGRTIKLSFTFDQYVGGFMRKVGTPNIHLTFDDKGSLADLSWNLSLLG